MKNGEITLTQLIQQANTLSPVSLDSAHLFRDLGPEMAKELDQELIAREDLRQLIGNNPQQVMFDNHQHHATFMATIFCIGGYTLLARTLPWVYRAYSAHGFSYDYFTVELKGWKKIISTKIPLEKNRDILAVYDWMIENHDALITLSQREPEETMPIGDDWLEAKNNFTNALLEGDQRQCLALAEQYIEQTGGVNNLYLHIIQPAMYDIGRMWEKAEISVAQEHLASAIISRIMVNVSAALHLPENTRGKVLITTVQKEFHEIGAWMISDLLEQDGWSVRYLGVNTPTDDLLDMLGDYLPHLLVLSATMPFNLEQVQGLVERIRQNPLHSSMKIMVGGRVFLDSPELWQRIGADGLARNTEEAVHLARSWSPLQTV